MKVTNALKKVEKVTNKKMVQTRIGNVNGNTYHLDYNNKYTLSFMAYPDTQEIYLIVVDNKKDPNNSMIDYFTNIFFDNISQALRFLQSK